MASIRKRTEFIVIHCSDTPADMDIGAAEIKKWHVEDNGWSDNGYHFVIRRDGVTEEGRPVDQVGAHARGYNSRSIGICLIGGKVSDPYDGIDRRDLFSKAQFIALERLVRALSREYPGSKVVGHRDLGSPKTCPNFDVGRWVYETFEITPQSQAALSLPPAKRKAPDKAPALKGKRTVLFNAVMPLITAAAAAYPEANIDIDEAGAQLNALLAAAVFFWGMINVLLRIHTDTPVGKAKLD